MKFSSRTQQLVSTGMSNSNTTDTQLSTDSTKYDNDYLLEDLCDLVNPKFRAWYCREFFRLGKDKVLVMASQARADGKNPSKLFSFLLKNA